MTCKQCQDLLPEYLTDGLDPSEAELARRHLNSGCPSCAAAVVELEQTLALLPLALETVAPSVAVKDRLMRKLDDAPRFAAPLRLSGDAARPVVHHSSAINTEPLGVRIFRLLVPAAIAAGLAIIVTHAVVTHNQKNLTRRLQAEEFALNAQQTTIAQLERQLVVQRQTVKMLQSPQLKMVKLDGAGANPSATANIIWDQASGQWLLLASRLSPLPKEKTYELWFITADQKKIRAGEFAVDAQGSAEMTVPVPSEIGPLAVAAVTDEKAGGVDQPEGTVQLVGKIQ